MKKIFLSLFLVLIAIHSTAQWTDDPSQNTVVNNLSGSQAVPHIAYDDEGNFYIGFYSNETGNYNIRLQYFTFDGVAQWDAAGLLVSNHAQNSWVTDWDLATDNNGNCVLAFNDVRDGNANVYAYAISPEGNFLWGADGIQLTSNPEDEYAPSITVNADNNTIVSWQQPGTPYRKAVIQKITPDGTLSWGASGISYQSGAYSYGMPQVLGVEGDNFLMAFYKETGSFPAIVREIYVQKFNASGSPVWASDVLVSNSNGINPYNNFNMASDNANGIIIAWMDDRNSDMNIDGAVQWILSDGTTDWPENGSVVNANEFNSDQNLQIIGVSNENEVVVSWSKKSADQNQTAVSGQKFSSSGERLWGESGKDFIPMSAMVDGADGGAIYNGTNSIFIYEEFVSGSAFSHVSAFAVDNNGIMIWDPTTTLMASRTTSKVHLVLSQLYNNQLIATWEEGDNSDIYMQNIYTDGSMGEAALNSDATLSDLTVNTITIAGFDPEVFTYSMAIPDGDPLPIVDAMANFSGATVEINQAAEIPGSAIVLVIAEDGVNQETYTVDFYVASNDATLSAITIDGETIADFNPELTSYEVDVPEGQPVPEIGATPSSEMASMEITQATDVPGEGTIVVTAQDGTTQMTYTVHFNLITAVANLYADEISIVPNPVVNKFYISGLAGNTQVSIIDLLGKKVISQIISGKQEINTSFLKSGIYFAVIYNDTGKMATIKFIQR